MEAKSTNSATETAGTRQVFFYAFQCLPSRSDSGAAMRVASNLRAYCELGFDVEYTLFHRIAAALVPGDRSAFPTVAWTSVEVTPGPCGAPSRLAYAAAFPLKIAWPYHFHTFDSVRRAVEERARRAPGAIHHFEFPTTANVIPWLPGLRAVYSCHDIETDLLRAQMTIDGQLQDRPMLSWEKRRLRFAGRAERLIARRSKVVLCITSKDAGYMGRRWGCTHARVLPMSVATGMAAPPARSFAADGAIRLLHLGSLGHVPGYRSLEFLFEQVFPRLDAATLDRIRLDVVGRIPEDERSRRILDLGRRWPQVRFHGWVNNLDPFYRGSDLQLVGCTESTGLRTRIVESFASGLPVLSTVAGADGTAGMHPGENVLLARDAAEFAAALDRVSRDPGMLPSLAAEGRLAYDRHYSAQAVVRGLSDALAAHLGSGAAVNQRAA